MIAPCDLFINNAQADFAQTELLYEMWERWQGQEKYIWNVSTMMTQQPINTRPDGQSDIKMSFYRIQKLALEEASRQLSFKSNWPEISIIRPGGVATQQDFDNTNKANVDKWVSSVIDTFTHNDNIKITDISIAYTRKRIPL